MARWTPSLDISAKRRIDQICVRFEAAWQDGVRPAVEPYLAGVPEPERSALLQELLLLDVDYRLRGGQTPGSDEYLTAFPEQRQIVEDVFRQSGLGGAARPAGARCFGDYELLEEIARGGMGVVYRARQISLDRIVALKMILAGSLASETEVERFQREAAAAASLQHPNIIAIHEVGRHEGQHYFTMDFVAGKNLAQTIREKQLTIRQTAECLRTLALAVDYAHQHRTLHRDLKPSNILIDESGRPRITDFGLAKRVQAGPDLTGSGQVLGTPGYMSPEQVAGRLAGIGPESDIYSLGAILYEMLAGRPPFCAESAADVLLQVLHSEPAALRLLKPELPRDLETICLNCLEKTPSARYPTAAALADDLDRFLRSEPIRARPAGRLARAWRWCKRKPLVAALAGVTLTLLVVVAVGASIAAVLLARERNATLRAERVAVEKLWQSYLDQARAQRWSGRPGRRVESLAALSNAAAIRPSLELRNEAIACLALVDLRIAKQWDGLPSHAFAVAFDSRFERYSVGDAQGNLSIRSVSGNRELLRLPGPGFPAWVVRFSPCGRWLAAKYHPAGENDNNRVWIWDLARGRTLLKTQHPISNVALAFSPDQRSLAAARLEGGISFYDLTTGAETKRLPSETPIPYLAFHPDGTRFAATTLDGRILIRSTANGDTLHVLPGIKAAVWHPNGKLLAACSSDSQIRVYHSDSWQERATLEGQTGPFQLAFSRGHDLLASAGSDLTLRLWHPLDCTPLLTMPGVALAGSLGFASDDALLAGCLDGSRISLWEVIPTPECRRLIVEPPADERIWDTDISPDGRLLAGACTQSVRLWDLGQGDQLARLPGRELRAAKFTRDGSGLIVSGEDGLSKWPIAWSGPTGVEALRIDPAERILLPAGTATRGCSVSADGCTLAVAVADAALLVDLKTQQEKSRFGGQRGQAGAALSPDGTWLACTTWHGSGAKVFDTRNGNLVLSVPDTDNCVAAFSPDGRWLVVGTGPEYRLWSVGSWQFRNRIARSGTFDLPGPAVFAPDSRLLALLPSRPAVQLIDPATGLEVATLETPDVHERITTLSFSPDGAHLVAGSLARRLHVWDLRRLRQRLAAMRLDWDLPPYGPSSPHASAIDAAISSSAPRIPARTDHRKPSATTIRLPLRLLLSGTCWAGPAVH